VEEQEWRKLQWLEIPTDPSQDDLLHDPGMIQAEDVLTGKVMLSHAGEELFNLLLDDEDSDWEDEESSNIRYVNSSA
jgi:hypothetical protein